MSRRLARMPRLKNPKFTERQESEIFRAERLGAKATMIELGVAEYLKTHMPCDADVEEARDLLAQSLAYRTESREIHSTIGRMGRKGRPMPAKKSA